MTAVQTMPAEKLAYSITEAAKALGISKSTIFQEMREGRLACRKRGKTTLILKDELVRYLNDLPEGGRAAA